MGEWTPSRPDGPLLGGRGEGLRNSEKLESRRRRSQDPVRSGRIPFGDYGEVDRELSWQTPRSGSLQARLHQHQQRWSTPWEASEDAFLRYERRMGGQPGESRLEARPRRGRDGKASREATRAGRSRRQRAVTSGKEGEEEQFEHVVEKEKEEKEEEEKEGAKGKRQGKERAHQEPFSSVRRNSFGSRSNRKIQDQEEGKEVCKRKGKEEGSGRERLELRGHRQQQQWGGEFPFVWGGSPNKADLGEVSRSLDSQHHRDHPEGPRDSERTAMGGEQGCNPSDILPILAPVPTWEDDGGHEQRGPELELPPRFAPAGEGERCVRRRCAAVEIARADCSRLALHSGATPRASSSRRQSHDDPRGELGSREDTSRGDESKSSGIATLESKARVREKARATSRKRQRSGQGSQRKAEEGRRGRQRRQSGKEGLKRDSGELADSVTVEDEKGSFSRELADSVTEVGEKGRSEAGAEKVHGRDLAQDEKVPPVFLSEEFFQGSAVSTDAVRPDFCSVSPSGKTFVEMTHHFHDMLKNCIQVQGSLHSKVRFSGGPFPLPDAPVALKEVVSDLSSEEAAVLSPISAPL